MVSTLVSKCFGSPWLGHTIKQTMKIQTVDPDILYFDFLKKGSGTSFSIKFCAWFLKKNISHIIFYQLIKFHCLIAFISWDISKNVFVVCYPIFDVINWPKTQNRNWNIQEQKELLTHYSLVLLIYTPWKHQYQKKFRFSDVLRGYR